MYSLNNFNIFNDNIKNENKTVKNKIKLYNDIKKKYDKKQQNILLNLDNKINSLNQKYNILENNIMLEYKIIKRFVYKLQHIVILINDDDNNGNRNNNNNNDNENHNNGDDNNNNNKQLYLFLNKIYDNINENKIIKTIVQTLYNNRNLKFETSYLYENTFTYTYNYNDIFGDIFGDVDLDMYVNNNLEYTNAYNERDNNPISKLFLFDNIDKIKQKYKHFYLKELEKSNNKNKTFNKQLINTKKEISILENKNKNIIDKIRILRNDKMDNYRKLNKVIYNSFLDVLSNKNCNMGSINEFYFFDSKEIYNLIECVKNNKIKIRDYKLDMKNLEFIKTRYNSKQRIELHSSIKLYNNKTSYGDKNYKPYNIITQNQLFDMIKNSDNSINNNYPIIINDLEGFKVFENKITEIFAKFIFNKIKIAENNISIIENEKMDVKNELDYYLKKKANLNKNAELYNNYKYYKRKLKMLEKEILKEMFFIN